MQIKRASQMGTSTLSWLQSRFHFSFAHYYNPENIQFGVLRVVNDDWVAAQRGFAMHPHENMEILTYVISGALTHTDSMGNRHTLTRGDVQYMSAGSGLQHSEENLGMEPLHLLQLWVLPNRRNTTPRYGESRPAWDLRNERWLTMCGGEDGLFALQQDVNIRVLYTKQSQTIDVLEGRQAYLILIEGEAIIEQQALHEGDAVELVEERVSILPKRACHMLLVEMKKG